MAHELMHLLDDKYKLSKGENIVNEFKDATKKEHEKNIEKKKKIYGREYLFNAEKYSIITIKRKLEFFRICFLKEHIDSKKFGRSLIMKRRKLTEEYVEVAKRYRGKFNMGLDGYENVDYDEFSNNEIIALAERSIELGTEMPTTLYDILGDPVFIEED